MAMPICVWVDAVARSQAEAREHGGADPDEKTERGAINCRVNCSTLGLPDSALAQAS